MNQLDKSILTEIHSPKRGKIISGVPLQNVQGRREMFYLTKHSTHFIYGYMASDIW